MKRYMQAARRIFHRKLQSKFGNVFVLMKGRACQKIRPFIVYKAKQATRYPVPFLIAPRSLAVAARSSESFHSYRKLDVCRIRLHASVSDAAT
jgi:hypothetical protein